MKERLQKIISASGIASRRHAEELICAGRVTCNGVVCKLGDCADAATDIILVDGKEIQIAADKVYILLNKPRGFVTTLSDEKGRKNVAQLVTGCGVRVYPVGRLDMDSEGLLLLTNDGAFANRMMHPSHNVDKTYLVWVTGYSTAGLHKLKEPIILDGYQIRRPEVRLIASNAAGIAKLEITIHEGRNRQVRRMCDAAGMQVTRLQRISEGSLQLGNLPCGNWRYLTKEEIDRINAVHIIRGNNDEC